MILTESLRGAGRASIPTDLSDEGSGGSPPLRLYRRLRMARRYLISYYQCLLQPDLCRNVKTYCAFLGHGRSGSTVVSALLDAHRQIILGDRVSVLGHLAAGFSRDQVFRVLLTNSGLVASRGQIKGGRDGRTYSYAVPGQWQGRFENLQVIGSRNAGPFTRRIGSDPRLLDLLRQSMTGLSLKFIQVIRNPFDVISTMNLRSGRELSNGIHEYFLRCESVARAEERIDPSDLFRVRHETFLERPQFWLSAMCGFLGLEASGDYLDACSGILYKSPSQTRSKVPWTPELIASVHRQIMEFDFLEGYSFET